MPNRSCIIASHNPLCFSPVSKVLILSVTLDEYKVPLPTPQKKLNGALGGDSGEKVGGGVSFVGYWLMLHKPKKSLWHPKVAKIWSAHFQTGFYINGLGQVSESFFLKLSESLYTEGTYLCIRNTNKWILHNGWPLKGPHYAQFQFHIASMTIHVQCSKSALFFLKLQHLFSPSVWNQSPVCSG